MQFTPINAIVPRVDELRQTFTSGKTRTYEWRVQQLQALGKALSTNRDQIRAALVKDLHMDPLTAGNEVDCGIYEIEDTISSLKSWMEPTSAGIHIIALPGSGKIYKDPYGVVLLISPWNYPCSLVIKPLIGAIAAGNCVVIKPSEVSEKTSALLGQILTDALDKKAFFVVQGAVKETEALLKLRFDTIMYTGNGTVGKIVMRAAAENLTPVLLELGGKSPVYVDKSADIKKAAPRIAWGKWTNAGQTCIAPDYVLVHASKYKEFLHQMKEEIVRFYGNDPMSSSDFGRIINSRHAQRLADLIPYGKIEHGGTSNIQECYVAPTLLTDVDLNSKLMTDEIFGPLLPVIPIESVGKAIEFINERPKPLALYVFGSDQGVIDTVLSSTSSGNGCVNEVLLQNVCRELPFGGVGPSGMGAYNGKHSFDAFTHKKSILQRPLMADVDLRFPPFTDTKIGRVELINTVTRKLPSKKTAIIWGGVLALILAYWFFGRK